MLTPSAVQNAKPQAKPYKLTDERGMFMLVQPSGAKWWRFTYRRPGTGKRNTLSLGTFPDVSLKRAREKRDEARALLADGIDPGERRKAEAEAGEDTFEAVAEDWLALKARDWTQNNYVKERIRLFKHAVPWIGHMPIKDIGVSHVRSILDRVIKHGNIDTARRVRQTMSCVFRYAIAHERATNDPAHALVDFLPTHRKRNFAHVTDPARLGELLRAIYGYSGGYVVGAALKLAPLLLLRPGELRQGEWVEVDLDGALWAIPARRMKLKKAVKLDPTTPPHLVPLASQAVAILRELQLLTGQSKYLFPGARSRSVPMSNATMNAALKRMGFGTDVIQPHGFRHSGSTALHEIGWSKDAIERQLSHKERGISGVYNKAQYMDERKKMMQAWADYLDGLRAGADVLPFKRKMS
ncbi:MAG: integrase arm-type DNA-binding domain-containing protein [Rudaea sp.]|uniref:tyrosine-type recombinase/integrase n=1 Tax=Rudaea sp. TaxID=2136325 RepID=UPI0039E4984A